MVNYDNLKPLSTEAEAAAAIGSYTLSCSLAGFLIDMFFFGILAVQAIRYADSHGKDAMWIKLLAGSVAALTCLSTGYNWCMVSHFFVYNFGYHLIFMDHMPLIWLAMIDCANITVCQVFFTYRAYRLNNRTLWIPVVAILCILASAGSAISIRVIYPRVNSVLDTNVIMPAAVTWEATCMVADLIIIGSILYGLIKAKTGLAHTNQLITRVIRMTLESQVAASTIAVILLVDTSDCHADKQLGISILCFHSKIYVLGFFYSLNMRHSAPHASTITMNDTHPMSFSRTQAATIVIEQGTEMHVMNVKPPAIRLNRAPLVVNNEDEDNKSAGSGTATAYSAPGSQSKGSINAV